MSMSVCICVFVRFFVNGNELINFVPCHRKYLNSLVCDALQLQSTVAIREDLNSADETRATHVIIHKCTSTFTTTIPTAIPSSGGYITITDT